MTTTGDSLARFTEILSSVKELDTLRERLCEASRRMLGASGVVVTSETVQDGRTTVCWTHMLSRRLEKLQDSAGEGPMIDALRDGSVVLGTFDGASDDRWPVLRSHVSDLDFTGTMIAIPLRSDLSLRGVLLVHRDGEARGTDDTDARFLGSAIGTAVLQDPAIGAQGHIFAEVLTDRDIIHGATESIAREADLRHEDALALLRAMAYSRGQDVAVVAAAVLDGRDS